MADIVLSKLNKHYGSLHHAVKDVDLEIADREFVALVGPSGCGKSTTSVFVTHDQVEAMTLGDRVVVMRDGQVQQAGTPLVVYGHPVNKFVAGFIGAPAMNFLDVTLVNEGGTLVARSPALKLAVSEP